MRISFFLLLFMIVPKLLSAQPLCYHLTQALDITVTNPQSGPGSLEEVLNLANSSNLSFNIYFNVPGNIIYLDKPLPKIVPKVNMEGHNLTIDAQGKASLPIFRYVDHAYYCGMTFINTYSPDFVITNTNDSGPGSLRNAIEAINAGPSFGNISFNIPGDAPHVIKPLSSLPAIRRNVTIDGSTQPAGNYTGMEMKVVLDGSLAGNSSAGILLQSGNSKIYGLQIQNFGNGIFVEGSDTVQNVSIGNSPGKEVVLIKNKQGIEASDVKVLKISNCYIGINIAGDTGLGNTTDGINIRNIKSGEIFNNVVSGNGRGINGTNLNGSIISNNKIGTDNTGTKNRGNRSFGIANYDGLAYIEGNLISGNGAKDSGGGIYNNGKIVAKSNKIGTDITGTYAIPNYRGIEINNGVTQIGVNSAGGNLISGNLDAGVYCKSKDTTSILYNTIGLNANGTDSLGNRGSGIYCDCDFFTIQSNQISGNSYAGISIMAVSPASDFVKKGIISNNYIGLNKALNKAIGNGYGISINTPNLIYTVPVQITENVISGNKKHGIFSAADNVIIKNNYIGTTSSLLPGLGNGENGIDLLGASSVTIGSDGPNTIAYNKSYGVNMVTSGTDSCRFNLISRNKMFGNGQKGINIKVLPTQWAQDNIPTPVITGVKASQITGTSLPGALVELFVKDVAAALQGKTFVGDARADQSGKWVLKGNFSGRCEIAAVAIDQFNNTSEFAAYKLNLSINKGADTAYFCSSKTNVLAVVAPFASLTWSTGANVESTAINNPGVYFVTGSDICNNISSDTIRVLSEPAVVAKYSFETNGQQVLFNNQSVGAKNYVWKFGTGILPIPEIHNTFSLQQIIIW